MAEKTCSASMMATIPPDSSGLDGIPEYQYEPLIPADAVRVLILHPADRLEDPLRCSVVHHVYSTELASDDYCNDRHYSAVSYTWGADLRSHQLLIVKPSIPGAIGAAPAYLKIGANVDSLLRYLRKGHKAVPLWIDAVCLNQMDEEEKAQQIPKMGDVYRAAKKVHIWLGDDNVDDARRAFSVLRQVGLRDEWRPGQGEVSLLAKLFARPWFARRWIVQEAVLAHEAKFHCGSESLALPWVLLALKKAQPSTVALDALGYGPKMLLSSVGKYQEAPSRCSMLSLLWDLHFSMCSDPRDRVAAVYGLAAGTHRPPDLRYNEGAVQLYWDCATYFVNRDAMSAHELILHLAEFGSLPQNPQGQDSPSWVPDWSGSRRSLLHYDDGLKNILKSLYAISSPRYNMATSPIAPLPRGFTFRDYCDKFSHATQMNARGNVLQIHSHPLVFPTLAGMAEEVYRCESSDWQEVWSFFNHMGRSARLDHYCYTCLSQLLSAAHKGMWGRAMPVTDLEVLVSSTPSYSRFQENIIEDLARIGSILSRFSLVRIKPLDSAFVREQGSHYIYPPQQDLMPPGPGKARELDSHYHLAPRDAAVGDLLVPLIISRREGHTHDNFDHLLVAMCLRPGSSSRQGWSKGRYDSVSPFVPSSVSPFRHTVRWIGLTFNVQSSINMDSMGRHNETPGQMAYFSAMEMRWPGPYIFDVV